MPAAFSCAKPQGVAGVKGKLPASVDSTTVVFVLGKTVPTKAGTAVAEPEVISRRTPEMLTTLSCRTFSVAMMLTVVPAGAPPCASRRFVLVPR